MKLVKNFVFVVLFASALTINTYAGDMETPGYVPPPPPPDHSQSVPVPPTQDPGTGGPVTPPPTQDPNDLTEHLLYDLVSMLFSVF